MGNIMFRMYGLIDYVLNKEKKSESEDIIGPIGLIINDQTQEIVPLKIELNEEYIIKKYYLNRLFKNFTDDKSPKHYLNLECSGKKENGLDYDITLIIYELIDKLQNSKYKYFVRSNNNAGYYSVNSIRNAIIYGLYIIDNNDNISNMEIKIFTEYIFDSLINMFKSIIGDYKILRNNIKYENILNNIYNKLFKTSCANEMINHDKFDHIIHYLTIINVDERSNNDKLNIIHSILVEIK